MWARRGIEEVAKKSVVIDLSVGFIALSEENLATVPSTGRDVSISEASATWYVGPPAHRKAIRASVLFKLIYSRSFSHLREKASSLAYV